ncbi:MAG: copper transporter [Thermoleophilaceae bacterium]|nr:copper transporter [Thermoleophilaceae bacterium]
MIDFRYHAMSLAAVFVALALGLLLGVTLGDTGLVNDVRGNLEDSLKKDLNESRQESSDRKDELERQIEFIGTAYPQLVSDRMSGERVATIGSATVAQSTLKSVTRAVEPAGADVQYIAQLLARPQYEKIASALDLNDVVNDETPTAAEADQLGRAVGRRLARGRNTGVMRRLVFSRLSGDLSRARLFAYARQEAPDADTADGKVFDGFERGVVAGLSQQASRVAGVENTTTEPSNIKWYNSLGLSTVDDIQSYAGYYALVSIFNGAKGDYGYKETADSIVPQVGP